jgi:metal-responsive CopG/Arc/MetJ family transcriptional regulator
MPIISFNISDNLKKFLKKMVTRDEYKNNSYVIRDALVRLMAEKDGARSEIDLEDLASIAAILPKVDASITITADRSNTKIIRKLNKIEFEFHDYIVQKTTFMYRDTKTMTFLIEGTMGEVQEFITHLNSVEDIKSFRYYIHEPSKE